MDKLPIIKPPRDLSYKEFVVKEPNEAEFKVFNRQMLESKAVKQLIKDLSDARLMLSVTIKEAKALEEWYYHQLSHLDKLPKEEYIRLMKELKVLKSQSTIQELESKLELKEQEIKKLRKESRKFLEENLELKAKYKP